MNTYIFKSFQASLIIPGENGELEVFAGTQNPTETQFLLAHVLGIPMNKINVRVKRIGVSILINKPHIL